MIRKIVSLDPEFARYLEDFRKQLAREGRFPECMSNVKASKELANRLRRRKEDDLFKV